MKKFLYIFIGLQISLSSFAFNANTDYTNSDEYDYSCSIKKESIISALTLDKGDANIVKFDVAVDKETCKIKGKYPIQIYWEIGKEKINGVTPCQGLTGTMRKYFGYEKSDIQVLNSHSIKMNMDIIEEASDIITPQIIVDVEKVNNECISKVTFDINGNELEVDTIMVDIGIFSVNEVALVNNGEVLYEED